MKTVLLLVIVFASSAFTTSSNMNTIVYQGIALDIESQNVLYREIHNEIYSNELHIKTETNFYDGKENLIANRKLDFTKSKTKPDYTLQDMRLGLNESVTNKNGVFKIVYRENNSSPTLTKSIAVPEPAIVDGGFNYFVKLEWENLMNGQIRYFNFISTARQDYFRFQLTKTDELKSGNLNTVVIKMEPAHYLLRAILEPIYITYNTGNKRIINYIGISNIKDIAGNNYFATLTYPTVGP